MTSSKLLRATSHRGLEAIVRGPFRRYHHGGLGTRTTGTATARALSRNAGWPVRVDSGRWALAAASYDIEQSRRWPSGDDTAHTLAFCDQPTCSPALEETQKGRAGKDRELCHHESETYPDDGGIGGL